jgi:hypothetical protein
MAPFHVIKLLFYVFLGLKVTYSHQTSFYPQKSFMPYQQKLSGSCITSLCSFIQLQPSRVHFLLFIVSTLDPKLKSCPRDDIKLEQLSMIKKLKKLKNS